MSTLSPKSENDEFAACAIASEFAVSLGLDPIQAVLQFNFSLSLLHGSLQLSHALQNLLLESKRLPGKLCGTPKKCVGSDEIACLTAD